MNRHREPATVSQHHEPASRSSVNVERPPEQAARSTSQAPAQADSKAGREPASPGPEARREEIQQPTSHYGPAETAYPGAGLGTEAERMTNEGPTAGPSARWVHAAERRRAWKLVYVDRHAVRIWDEVIGLTDVGSQQRTSQEGGDGDRARPEPATSCVSRRLSCRLRG